MSSLLESTFLWGVTLEPEARWTLEEQSLPADSCSVQVRTPPLWMQLEIVCLPEHDVYVVPLL